MQSTKIWYLAAMDSRKLQNHYKKLITRWDSEHELLYDILRVQQSTTDSHINSETESDISHTVFTVNRKAKHHKKNLSQR